MGFCWNFDLNFLDDFFFDNLLDLDLFDDFFFNDLLDFFLNDLLNFFDLDFWVCHYLGFSLSWLLNYTTFFQFCILLLKTNNLIL